MTTSRQITNTRSIINEYLGELDEEELNDEYFYNPSRWVRDFLGVEFWEKQDEMCQALVTDRNVAVKAGHGVGKSFWVACMICWWIGTRPLNKVFVATTAPGVDQVTGVIWREVHKLQRVWNKRYEEYVRKARAGLDTSNLPNKKAPGYITQDNKWKDDLGNLLGQGRKPPDNKEEDSFQGFHDGYVLSIGDEACGLSEGMINALANITTNANSKRVLIGNPTNPASYFAKIFQDNTGTWSLHTISVLDAPTLHGAGTCPDNCTRKDIHVAMPVGLGFPKDMLEKMSGWKYVGDMRRDYGEEHPRYVSRVLGEFAFELGEVLFSERDLAQGKNAVVVPDIENPYVVLGVDIARQGKDKTYIYRSDRGFVHQTDENGNDLGEVARDIDGEPLAGIRVRKVDEFGDTPFVTQKLANGKEVQGQADRIHGWAMAIGAREVRVDAAGMGKGVIDPLWVLNEAAGYPYVIIEVYGSSTKNIDLRAFANERAFRFSEVRRRMFRGTIDFDPQDLDLVEQLGGIIYSFSVSGGGLLIESKESMKNHGKKSPDAVDGFSYAAMDYEYLVGNPLSFLTPGQIVTTNKTKPIPMSWDTGNFHW